MPYLPEFLRVRPIIIWVFGVHRSPSWKRGMESPYILRGHTVSHLLCRFNTLVYGTKQDPPKWENQLLFWLNITLRAMTAGAFKYWNAHFAKAFWLVNIRWSANWAGPAQ